MHRLVLGLLLVAFPLTAAEPLRIGFAGLLHSHCWTQLRNVGTIDGVEFVGIAEANPELREEARKHAPDAVFYDDWDSLQKEGKPDIVWAFLENNRHAAAAEFFAPRGIHLIFEKPLAHTLADAKRIRDLAHEHNIFVMTNYQMAWWATNQHAKTIADSGELGHVWRLHGIVGHGGPGSTGARSKYFFAWLTDPHKNGGGALVDFGCYNALWSLWYKGRPQKVYAQVNRLQTPRFPKVEDNSVMILTYPDGVGIFEGSWDLPHSFQDLEILGREASLKMTRNGVHTRKGRRPEWQAAEVPELSETRNDPIRYMVDRVNAGQAPDNIMALDINVDVVEILEAAKQSIRTGAAVWLD